MYVMKTFDIINVKYQMKLYQINSSPLTVFNQRLPDYCDQFKVQTVAKLTVIIQKQIISTFTLLPHNNFPLQKAYLRLSFVIP